MKLSTQISTHFDRFLPVQSNINIFINFTFDCQHCPQILTFWSITNFSLVEFLNNFHFFTQILTFWLILNFALKFHHFDWLLLLHSNFNIWSIPTFSLNLHHFYQFNIFHSNFNILINLSFGTESSTLQNFVLKFQHFDW